MLKILKYCPNQVFVANFTFKNYGHTFLNVYLYRLTKKHLFL